MVGTPVVRVALVGFGVVQEFNTHALLTILYPQLQLWTVFVPLSVGLIKIPSLQVMLERVYLNCPLFSETFEESKLVAPLP